MIKNRHKLDDSYESYDKQVINKSKISYNKYKSIIHETNVIEEKFYIKKLDNYFFTLYWFSFVIIMLYQIIFKMYFVIGIIYFVSFIIFKMRVISKKNKELEKVEKDYLYSLTEKPKGRWDV